MYLCGMFVSILNWYIRSLLTKALFLVIIEALNICRKAHKKMLLHTTLYTMAKYTVTGFTFNMKGLFVGDYWNKFYPSFSMVVFFSFIHLVYIEWIYVVQILQIRKFWHQVRVALCNWLVVLNIYKIQPGSCIGQARHVGWFWSLSYREVQMWQLLGNLHHHIWSS